MKTCWKCISVWVASLCMACSQPQEQPVIEVASSKGAPRLVNLVNFIRQTDYRLPDADSLLFDAVVHQLELMKDRKSVV